jgi:hypothetical protein
VLVAAGGALTIGFEADSLRRLATAVLCTVVNAHRAALEAARMVPKHDAVADELVHGLAAATGVARSAAYMRAGTAADQGIEEGSRNVTARGVPPRVGVRAVVEKRVSEPDLSIVALAESMALVVREVAAADPCGKRDGVYVKIAAGSVLKLLSPDQIRIHSPELSEGGVSVN